MGVALAEDNSTPTPTPTQTVQGIETPTETPTMATSDFAPSASGSTPTPDLKPNETVQDNKHESQTLNEPELDADSSASSFTISLDSLKPGGTHDPAVSGTPTPTVSPPSDLTSTETPTLAVSGTPTPTVSPPSDPTSTETPALGDSGTPTPTVSPLPESSPTETPTIVVSDFSTGNTTPPAEDKSKISDTNTSKSSEGSDPSLTGEEKPVLMAVIVPKAAAGEESMQTGDGDEKGEGDTHTLGEVVVASLPPGSIGLTPGGSTGYTFTGSYSNGVIEILQSGNYHLTDNLTSIFTASGTSTNHKFAIKISASDVVLDGNGKTVTIEPGTKSSIDAIQINGSDDTVQNFDVLINASRYGNGICVNMTSQAGENAIIQDNRITGGINAIMAIGTVGKNMQISDNTLSGFYTNGISFNSSGLISGNTVDGGSKGIYLLGGGDAIVSGNTVTGSTGGGIYGSSLSSSPNYTVSGNQVRNVTGVSIELGSNSRGVISGNTVTNCTSIGIKALVNITGNTVTHCDLGIGPSSGGSLHPLITISNNTISDNSIGINPSDRNLTITGNTISNNSNSGLIFSSDYGADNTVIIYNNNFTNNQNVGNTWRSGSNPTWTNPSGPTAGTNIIGGPTIAGNYWGNPGGTGYSDTLTPNVTGYSSTPYMVKGNTYDTAPLVRTPTPTQTPSPTPSPTSAPNPVPTATQNPEPLPSPSPSTPNIDIALTTASLSPDAIPGSRAQVTLHLENLGSTTLSPDANILLTPVNDLAKQIGQEVITYTDGTYSLSFDLQIPKEPGTYVYTFKPVQITRDPVTGEEIRIPVGELITFTVLVGTDGSVQVTTE